MQKQPAVSHVYDMSPATPRLTCRRLTSCSSSRRCARTQLTRPYLNTQTHQPYCNTQTHRHTNHISTHQHTDTQTDRHCCYVWLLLSTLAAVIHQCLFVCLFICSMSSTDMYTFPVLTNTLSSQRKSFKTLLTADCFLTSSCNVIHYRTKIMTKRVE